MRHTTRRQLLSTTALLALTGPVGARGVSEALPRAPSAAFPPGRVTPGPYVFFLPEEAAAVDAIVARLIPADSMGPGALEAGCTVFIDRQLAGPYGGHDGLYMEGPFSSDPLPSQGIQSPLTPRRQYRDGLAALGTYCRANFGGRDFAGLNPAEQDKLLSGMEKGEVALPGFDSRMLFQAVHANTMEGFFADPIYGGNRDMIGWQLVGFPGARYDYRDVIANPDQPYKLPPIGLLGRPGWDRAEVP